jgi:two-component system OmpR family response regulator
MASEIASDWRGSVGWHNLEGGAHILIVDDDREILDLVSRFLRKHGYRVSGARNGFEMRERLAAAEIDLIILDLMLPGEDGLSLCRDIRSRSSLPIIVLTALGEDTDRIVGLEMGADDYLAKPFNSRELLARIKAVLRRAGREAGKPATGQSGKSVQFAGWQLDLVRHELTSPQGVVTDLSAGEYDMLIAFIEHPQRVLSRDQLLDLARSRVAAPFDRSVDVQVSRLRRKLEPGRDGSALIKTVRGAGYLFIPAVERR